MRTPIAFRTGLAALLVAATAGGAAADTLEVRMATLAPDGSSWMKILNKGSAEVNAKTENRVTIKYYAGGVQGDERDVVRKINLGQLDGAALTSVGLSMVEESIRVLELPRLFNSVEELDYVADTVWPYYGLTAEQAKAGGMNFAMMSLHYSSQFTWNFTAQPWNGYATLEEFYNSYENGDVRKKNNFIVGPQLDFGGSAILDYAADDSDLQLNYTPAINELTPNCKREAGARPGKFSYKQLGRPDMDNDYPIVRLGDLYLIRAEAKARQSGNWNDALADVNVIRRRAKVADYTTLSAEEFLKERGREMFQEGVRRTDLIRFGRYNDAWWEKPASQPFRNLFPIPQDAINAANGTLTQNPGY